MELLNRLRGGARGALAPLAGVALVAGATAFALLPADDGPGTESSRARGIEAPGGPGTPPPGGKGRAIGSPAVAAPPPAPPAPSSTDGPGAVGAIVAFAVAVPARGAALSSRVGGTVVGPSAAGTSPTARHLGRPPRAGDRVSAGAVLVTLDAVPARAALARAELALVEARLALAEARRTRALAASDWRRSGRAGERTDPLASGALGVELAAAREAAARAERHEARAALDSTVLRAPFDAWLEVDPPLPGRTLEPGELALTLVGTDPPLLRASLSEADVDAPGGPGAEVRLCEAPGPCGGAAVRARLPTAFGPLAPVSGHRSVTFEANALTRDTPLGALLELRVEPLAGGTARRAPRGAATAVHDDGGRAPRAPADGPAFELRAEPGS